jgi:hypothetical protein
MQRLVKYAADILPKNKPMKSRSGEMVSAD